MELTAEEKHVLACLARQASADLTEYRPHLARLERDGYIEPVDPRVNLVLYKLTPRGRDLAASLG